MAKGYWVSCYHSVKDPEKLAAYAKLAAPSIQQAGGRFVNQVEAAGRTNHRIDHDVRQRVFFNDLRRDFDGFARRQHPGFYSGDLKITDDGFELRAQNASRLMRRAVNGHGVLKSQRGDRRRAETTERREGLDVGQRARAA